MESLNNPNYNKKDSEKNEERKNKLKEASTKTILEDAKTSFVEDKLDEDVNYFNIEDNDFNAKNLKGFLEYINNESKYSDLSINIVGYKSEQKNEISLQLKNEVIKMRASYEKNSDTLFKLIKSSNNIPKESTAKIKEEILKLSNLEKIDLIKSWLKRFNFLQNLKLDKVKEKDISEKLDWIDFKKIEKKYKNSEFDFETYEILEKFKENPNNLEPIEVIKILNIFSEKEQKILLGFYDGVISLNDLINEKIINKGQATEYIIDNQKELFPNESKSNLKKILKGVDFTLIYVSFQELKDKDLSKILKNNNVLKDFFQVQEDAKKIETDYVKEDFYEQIDLDSDKNIHNNFIEFIKNRSNLKNSGFSQKFIESLKNLNEWWYLEFENGWQKYYSRINWVDLGESKIWKYISLQNLSDPAHPWKVRKDSVVHWEWMTYKELYYYFRNAWLDPKAWIKILSKEEFENEELEEVEEKNDIKTEKALKEKLLLEWILTPEQENWKLSDLSLWDSKSIKWGWYRDFEIEWNEIVLKWGEKWTLSQLFDLLVNNKSDFKFENRVKKFDDFLDKVNLWNRKKEDFKIKSDKLYYCPKDAKEIVINYFTTWAWDEAVSIHKITDSDIEYTIWKIKEKWTWKKDKKWNEIKNKEFKANDEYSKSWFNNFLKDTNLKDWDDEANLEPNTDWIEIIDKEKQWENLQMKWWFFKSWMSWMSLTEIISSGKMLVDWIEEHFKLWNQLKSAKLAEKMSWALPDAIRVKLKAKQEAESKKMMESLVNEVLTELNSKDEAGLNVFDYLEKEILYNKHANIAEVFAGMKFMLEKKWGLNADWFLENRWKFIWYQRLWWKVWDKLYNDTKKEREKAAPIKWWKPDPSFFNEEDLIEKKLSQMTKQWLIFSRADKDFSASRNKGHERRHKKWSEEAWALYTFANRFNYFLANLWKWEDDRAIWALETVMWKNKWDPTLMNKGPFIMAMWGFAKDYDDVNIKRLVTLAWWSPYTSLYFAADKDAMDIYQKSIKKFFTDKWQKSKADRLDYIINKWKRKDKAKDLANFWDENATELWKFLNYSDWTIPLKQWDSKEDKDWIYKGFFETVWAVFSDWEFEHTNGAYLKTWMYQKHSGAAYVWFKIWEDSNIRSDTGWGYGPEESKKITEIYYNTLDWIKNNDSLTIEKKEKLFEMIYSKFEPTIRRSLWAFVDKRNWEWGREINKNSEMLFMSDLRKHNFILKAWEDKNLSEDAFMKKAFNNFISWWIISKSDKELKTIQDDVQEKVKKYSNPDYDPLNNTDYSWDN